MRREAAVIHRVRAGGTSRAITPPVPYIFRSRSPRPARPAVPGQRYFAEAGPALPGHSLISIPPVPSPLPRQRADE